MNTEDRARVGQQRSEAYWFLSKLYANPLDAHVINRLALVASQESGENGFAEDIFAVFREAEDRQELATRLAVEHTRLFCGISEEYGPPPPYESLWREGQLMGESTVQVATFYLQAGYKLNEEFSPCDHLVEELRFMATLCNEEIEAGKEAQAENMRQARELQRRFLDEHLMAWVGKYCQRIANESKEPLYQALSRITMTVLEQDARQLRED
ncbi:MAG TPA: molecular chaperone TorD family protein [Noviherbaspirillum sp.]